MYREIFRRARIGKYPFWRRARNANITRNWGELQECSVIKRYFDVLVFYFLCRMRFNLLKLKSLVAQSLVFIAYDTILRSFMTVRINRQKNSK